MLSDGHSAADSSKTIREKNRKAALENRAYLLVQASTSQGWEGIPCHVSQGILENHGQLEEAEKLKKKNL